MRSWKRPRVPLAGLTLFAASGIFLADSVALNPVALGVAGCCFLCLSRRSTAAIGMATLCVFALLHIHHHFETPAQRLARSLDFNGRAAGVRGVVDGEPQPAHGGKWLFPLRTESLELHGHAGPIDARILVRWQGTPPRYGDLLQIRGNLRNLPPPRNPGSFDRAAYFARKGIRSELTSGSEARVLGRDRGNRLIAFALSVRQRMRETLRIGLEDCPETAAVIESMVLGVTDETDPETQELFRKTGTLHLFAVSGLNVAMFALIAWALLKPLGLGRARVIPLMMALMFFYATLTGLSASGVRAAIMASVVLGAYLADRRPSHANGLLAAAFGILAWDTNQLFSAGFQLSFGVVLSILLLANPLDRLWQRLVAPDPFLPRTLFTPVQRLRHSCSVRARGVIAVTCAAWIGSLPLCVFYFHMISPVALLANLLVVPLAFAVLGCGTLALIAGAFSHGLTAVFNNAGWFAVHLILQLIGFLAALPGSHFHVAAPRLDRPLCLITVFDFETGAAIHIRTADTDWLLDTGSRQDYARTVAPHLRALGINRLDGILLSHGDTEHIGGALAALEDFGLPPIVDSALSDRSTTRRELHAELQRRGLGRSVLVRGDCVPLGPGVNLRVLYPPQGFVARTADDQCLVLRLEAGGTRVLFSADSGFTTQQWLLENEPDPGCDILVKNQRRADPFTDEALPADVVVTASDPFAPDHGIPQRFVEMLRSREIRLFRQDETGAVTIQIEPDGYSVDPFLPSRAR